MRLAVLFVALLTPAAASAHFRFLLPDGGSVDMFVTNTIGDPLGGNQKAPPCGMGTTMSGAVTTLQAGSVYGVRFEETITHEGHYRVALARSLAELPAATTDGSDCSVRTPQLATAPVLLDGQLQHSTPFSGPQTLNITVPNENCTGCVLQVVQYMRSTAMNCFYFKCARVDVVGATPEPPMGRGCGCSGADGVAFVMLLLLPLLRSRGSTRDRRRTPRHRRTPPPSSAG